MQGVTSAEVGVYSVSI